MFIPLHQNSSDYPSQHRGGSDITSLHADLYHRDLGTEAEAFEAILQSFEIYVYVIDGASATLAATCRWEAGGSEP